MKHPLATHGLPGTNKPLLVLLLLSLTNWPTAKQHPSFLYTNFYKYSISSNSFFLLWVPEKTRIMERVWDKRPERKPHECFRMHLSISPHKPGKTWPYSNRHLKLRGNVRVVFWEKSNSTNLDIIILIMHLWTLLTVLATFVSRQLLNLNSHTHTYTYTYILLPSHNLPTIPVWLLPQGSASYFRSNFFMLELVFFISGSPGILPTYSASPSRDRLSLRLNPSRCGERTDGVVLVWSFIPNM